MAAKEYIVDRVIFGIVSIALITNWYVRIEPAPCDYLFAMLIFIWFVKRYRQLKKHKLLLFAPFASFALIYCISLSSSPTLSACRYTLITMYLLCTSVFFADFILTHNNKAKTLFWGSLSISGLIASITGYLGQLGVPGFSWAVWGENRAVAGFKDPNVYGAFLVPIALLAVSKFRWAKGWENFKWWALCSLTISGVILSLSRGALLNLLVTGLIYFVLSSRLLIKHILKLSTILFGVAILTSVVFIVRSETSNALIQRAGFMPYDEIRFEKQKEALHLILQHPFGIGPGQSETVLQYATHNTYLRVLLENGWIAFTCFVALIVISLFSAFRRIRTTLDVNDKEFETVTIASLIGILVNGFVIDTLHWRHFWWLLGLAASSQQKVMRQDIL